MLTLLPLILALNCIVAQTNICDCPPYPLEQQYVLADLIFYGKVKDISLSADHINNLIKFDVKQVFKGGNNKMKEVVIGTCATQGCCGFSFKPKETYIVFAKSGPQGFTTTLCNLTQFYTKQLVKEIQALSRHP
jgi:hypothetical protein